MLPTGVLSIAITGHFWQPQKNERKAEFIKYWLTSPFCKQNLFIFIQWSKQGGSQEHISLITIMFCFLMNLHLPSKSNTNSTQIVGFILICLSFTTGHFHTCVLCKECSPYYILFLILGSVFSDCVVLYGDLARSRLCAVVQLPNNDRHNNRNAWIVFI